MGMRGILRLAIGRQRCCFPTIVPPDLLKWRVKQETRLAGGLVRRAIAELTCCFLKVKTLLYTVVEGVDTDNFLYQIRTIDLKGFHTVTDNVGFDGRTGKCNWRCSRRCRRC